MGDGWQPLPPWSESFAELQAHIPGRDSELRRTLDFARRGRGFADRRECSSSYRFPPVVQVRVGTHLDCLGNRHIRPPFPAGDVDLTARAPAVGSGAAAEDRARRVARSLTRNGTPPARTLWKQAE